jgi:hypothetical protein
MKLDEETQLTQTGVHGTNLIVPYVKKHVQFRKGVDEVAVIFSGLFEKNLEIGCICKMQGMVSRH